LLEATIFHSISHGFKNDSYHLNDHLGLLIFTVSFSFKSNFP